MFAYYLYLLIWSFALKSVDGMRAISKCQIQLSIPTVKFDKFNFTKKKCQNNHLTKMKAS